MDKIRVYYDRAGNTLTVWLDDPAKETVCDGRGHPTRRAAYLTVHSDTACRPIGLSDDREGELGRGRASGAVPGFDDEGVTPRPELLRGREASVEADLVRPSVAAEGERGDGEREDAPVPASPVRAGNEAPLAELAPDRPAREHETYRRVLVERERERRADWQSMSGALAR